MEYEQITLDEWVQWKEDIRQKLQEAAGNFVHIGYRLKQIRDSGMFGGAADVFGFAQEEYGLGKSTVSRFIAINEKFSEGGNSLELRAEFRSIGSSKLAEMLTLPDAECLLITEKTTVKEIRDLKNLGRQQASEGGDGYAPLEKCIFDLFSDEKRHQALNLALSAGTEGGCKQAAEAINPGGYATHKKGIVFLFLYEYDRGVAYKSLAETAPQRLSWQQFIQLLQELYAPVIGEEDPWAAVYGRDEPVATSQQEELAEGFNEGVDGGIVPPGCGGDKQEGKGAAAEQSKVTKRSMADKARVREPEPAAGMVQEEGEQLPGQVDVKDFPGMVQEESGAGPAGSGAGAAEGRQGNGKEETERDGNEEMPAMPGVRGTVADVPGGIGAIGDVVGHGGKEGPGLLERDEGDGAPEGGGRGADAGAWNRWDAWLGIRRQFGDVGLLMEGVSDGLSDEEWDEAVKEVYDRTVDVAAGLERIMVMRGRGNG